MNNKHKRWLSKMIISFVLFTGIIGSGMIIAFADEDISSLFKEWFHTKTESMVNEVSEEIESEREKQAKRLEEQLTAMIEDAEQDLIEFTNRQKEKRVEQLKSYADGILNDFVVDDEDDKQDLIEGLEDILQQAKNAMDELTKEKLADE